MGPAQGVPASGRWLAPVLARLLGGSRQLKGHARLNARPEYQRMLATEPFLKRLIPILIIIFLVIVAATRYVQLADLRDERDAFARNETSLVAEILWSAIANANLPTGDAARAAFIGAVVAGALPATPRSGVRRVLVTDAEGAVIAVSPYDGATVGSNLVDLFAGATPLLRLGADAGVITLSDASGEEVFAASRRLDPPLGAVIVVTPTAPLRAEWRTEVSINVSIFVGTSAILLVILYGYFAQATRAAEADRIYAAAQDRLDMALMRGRCGLWDWDLGSGRMFWSRSMFEILGMEQRDELIGFGEVNRRVHPEDGDLLSLAEYLYETGATSVDRMFRMRHEDGRWVWLRARAELSGQDGEPHLIGIAVDTTELIRQAERNKTADIRLRDAIETISEAFVLWDADNRLVMCNSKYQQLYGLPDEAVQRHMTYDEVMAAGRKPIVRAQIPTDGTSADAGSRSFEALLDDGRWLQVNERPTKDGGFVSVGTDITQIKRHEERLIESEKRLTATVADLRQSRQWLEHQAQQMVELADKLAEEKERALEASRAKSAFLANISHELRTPLNAIIGFSEIMQSGMFGELGSPKYAEYSRDIHASGTYLLGVINDVLDMSRIEAGRVRLEVETLALGELVDEAIRFVKAQSDGQKLAVEASVAPDLVLEGDRRSIKQILLNLLSNAVKFTPEGGSIFVRARHSGRQTVSISVEDSGIGIPREALRKLGTPFEQVQNQFTKSHKGSGLGLAITRSLAELHGGGLRIRSREGRGTIVSVRLPVRHPRVAAQGRGETFG